ncbi:MAG: hypothetical protein HQL76_06125 [Magnetococcales bacterium]|nr:hypothetical protein [Magnetococcales bacterium]
MKEIITLPQARTQACEGLPVGSAPMWNMKHRETYEQRLMEILDHGKRPFSYGEWIFDPETLVLRHRQSDYELDLERATTAAQLLDWILQISKKPGMQLEQMLTLLRAVANVRNVGSLQGAFCPYGRTMPPVKW